MDNKCKYIETPSWRDSLYNNLEHDITSKYIREKYYLEKKYTEYFIFITSSKYDKCFKTLTLNNESIVNIHEVFGKYDFIVRAFFNKAEFINEEKAFKDILLKPTKKCIANEKSIIFNEVIKEYSFDSTKMKFTLIAPNDEYKELNINRLNLINAFIVLNKKCNNRKKESIEPEDLLTLMPTKFSSETPSELIYKVYLTDNQSLIFYLNVNCRYLGKLNEFTTSIDKVVDDNGYQKTTYISTHDNVRSETIDRIKIKNGGLKI